MLPLHTADILNSNITANLASVLTDWYATTENPIFRDVIMFLIGIGMILLLLLYGVDTVYYLYEGYESRRRNRKLKASRAKRNREAEEQGGEMENLASV